MRIAINQNRKQALKKHAKKRSEIARVRERKGNKE